MATIDKKVKDIIKKVRRPAERKVKQIVKKEIRKDNIKDKRVVKKVVKTAVKKALKPIVKKIGEIQKESQQAGYGVMKLHQHYGTKNEAIKAGVELRNKGKKVRVLARRGRYAVYYQ